MITSLLLGTRSLAVRAVSCAFSEPKMTRGRRGAAAGLAGAEVAVQQAPVRASARRQPSVVAAAAAHDSDAAAQQPEPAAAAAEWGPAAPAQRKKKGSGGRGAAAAAAVDGAPAPKRAKAKGAAAPSIDAARLPELQAKGAQIAEQLARLYPDPPIPLDHGSHFQLLCAVVLSAQTTDRKVNEVTPALFRRAPDAAGMAALGVPEITDCIRQLGLAPTKAKNLQALSQMLLDRHGGAVPDTFEALEALPGVGHKTASVVIAQCFGRAAFPVDTHIHRLAQRWGLTAAGHSVEQTEADLKLVFPEQIWRDLHLQIIYFGREHCPAQRHYPADCPICTWAAVPPFDRAGASPVKAGQQVSGSSAKNGGKPTAGGGSANSSKRAGMEPALAAKRSRKPAQD